MKLANRISARSATDSPQLVDRQRHSGHLFTESASLLANRFDYLLDNARGVIR